MATCFVPGCEWPEHQEEEKGEEPAHPSKPLYTASCLRSIADRLERLGGDFFDPDGSAVVVEEGYLNWRGEMTDEDDPNYIDHSIWTKYDAKLGEYVVRVEGVE